MNVLEILDEIDMKPCPFCGNDEPRIYRHDNIGGSKTFFAEAVCPDCGFNAGVKRNGLRAADAWNALCASATRRQSRTKVPVGVTVTASNRGGTGK